MYNFSFASYFSFYTSVTIWFYVPFSVKFSSVFVYIYISIFIKRNILNFKNHIFAFVLSWRLAFLIKKIFFLISVEYNLCLQKKLFKIQYIMIIITIIMIWKVNLMLKLNLVLNYNLFTFCNQIPPPPPSHTTSTAERVQN